MFDIANEGGKGIKAGLEKGISHRTARQTMQFPPLMNMMHIAQEKMQQSAMEYILVGTAAGKH